MFQLKCPVQKYAWGRSGAESRVAALSGQQVVPTDRYAELWMGVHQNGPAVIASTGETLADFIKAHPNAVGKHEEGTLQFLFKVLSVGKALSVQSHPTEAQAKVLHAKDPKNYPDPHHKPEMAIALGDFELLCGFREPVDLLAHVKEYHEVTSLFDEAHLVDLAHETCRKTAENALRSIFSAIWKSPQDKIAETVKTLVERLKSRAEKKDLDHLLIRLDSQYPGGDVGVLAPIFLNHFFLKTGEATFLGPNEPHAYLSGDCIECMACSDNTIRAGLTPKFKDVETLCSSLTYKMSPPPFFHAHAQADGVVVYAPPVKEFAVQKITALAKTIPTVGASSILIVVEGEATIADGKTTVAVKPGDILFITADAGDMKVESASEAFHSFRAFTPAN